MYHCDELDFRGEWYMKFLWYIGYGFGNMNWE